MNTLENSRNSLKDTPFYASFREYVENTQRAIAANYLAINAEFGIRAGVVFSPARPSRPFSPVPLSRANSPTDKDAHYVASVKLILDSMDAYSRFALGELRAGIKKNAPLIGFRNERIIIKPANQDVDYSANYGIFAQFCVATMILDVIKARDLRLKELKFDAHVRIAAEMGENSTSGRPSLCVYVPGIAYSGKSGALTISDRDTEEIRLAFFALSAFARKNMV